MGIWEKVVLSVFLSVVLLSGTITAPSFSQVVDLTVTKSAVPSDIQLFGTGDPDTTTITLTVEGFGSTSLVDAKTDFILVLDESGSLSSSQFAMVKDFAVEFVNSLTVDADNSNVGVVMFSTDSRIILNLSDNKATIINTINSISQRLGATCIGCGLNSAATMFDNFGRSDAIPVVLVLTDGQNNRPTGGGGPSLHLANAINGLENRGVVRIAIGVGNNPVTSEINAIASDPDSEFAFIGISFSDLSALVDTIITQVQISSSPTSVNLVETTLDYIVNHASINPAPDSQITLPSGQLQLTWSDLGSKVGNNDGILESGEIFTASFTVSSDQSGNNLPVNDLVNSEINYIAPDGNPATTPIPQVLINVNSPPVAVVSDRTVSADSNCQGDASIDSGSFDPDGDPITIVEAPSGPYSLGDTLVTLTVSDGALSDSASATVTVVDTTPPEITAPADITQDATGLLTEVNIGVATASDNCSVAETNDAPSEFPFGDTTVTWTATDDSGNESTATQTITIRTPGDTKDDIISALNDLNDQVDDKKTNKGIEKAIKHITKSLKTILADGEHLDEKKGKKTFSEERKTVKDLLKIKDGEAKCKGVTSLTLEYAGSDGVTITITDKKNNVLGEFTGVVSGDEVTVTNAGEKFGSTTNISITGATNEEQSIHTSCSKPIGVGDEHGSLEISDLETIAGKSKKGSLPDELQDDAQLICDRIVSVDRIFAEIAIADATAGPQNDKVVKEIAKANKEMVKAQEDLDKGKLDKAIKHYEKAWKHAQHAIKHAAK